MSQYKMQPVSPTANTCAYGANIPAAMSCRYTLLLRTDVTYDVLHIVVGVLRQVVSGSIAVARRLVRDPSHLSVVHWLSLFVVIVAVASRFVANN